MAECDGEDNRFSAQYTEKDPSILRKQSDFGARAAWCLSESGIVPYCVAHHSR